MNGPICRKCGSDLSTFETPRQKIARRAAWVLYALLWISLLAVDLDSLFLFLIRQ